MATATMGLRRRVTVNNSPTPTGQQTSPSTSASTSANVSNKRSRAENNNSPSHGNLNSLSNGRDEPPTKKSRATGTGSSAKARANSPAVTEGPSERGHGHQTSAKSRNASGGKSSRTKSPSISTVTTTTSSSSSSSTNASSASTSSSTNVPTVPQVQPDIPSSFNVLTSTGWPAPSGNTEVATYTSMAGLNMSGPGQTSLCAAGSLALPPSIPYMATSMATFVGNATNLSKNSSVSYLDISNMTGGSLNSNSSSSLSSSYACKPVSVNSTQEPKGNGMPLPFSGVVPANGGSSNAYGAKPSSQPPQSEPVDTLLLNTVKNFQNDSMFNAYQPWVIKTYGDLAKTKTITIKKYARILRTLKGEEVNSAENSKFRFWVKSKGFHIGQPVGYDAKPADRIVGRHAVTSPGLDPALYVPTQIPHNKALNGAEGTVAPGRVYKKVAIVENFFDIIHAVHVDLEGRPGKHAGQKRTYRTITETYAFLPREAVTRFLLGCTECQRRPRTPSPSNLSNQSQSTPVVSTVGTLTGITTTTTTTTETVTPCLAATTITTTTTPTTTTPPSPTPAATALSAPQPLPSRSPKPREASHPPEAKSLYSYRHSKHHNSRNSSTIVKPNKERDKNAEIVIDKEPEKSENYKDRDNKYNPLSITNLLKKEPTSGVFASSGSLIAINDNLADCRRTPESDRASSRSSASSKRKRMLPEGRTPSPQPTVPLATPWTPGLDVKNTPIDYSIPITTSYLKHQQRIQAERDKAAAIAATEATLREEREREMREATSPIVLSMGVGESSMDGERFSPAAGLIDTNLNLLATIQHLHCQVMLALTERLRPSVLPASLVLPPTSLGTLPNFLMGTEFPMPMAHHHRS